MLPKGTKWQYHQVSLRLFLNYNIIFYILGVLKLKRKKFREFFFFFLLAVKIAVVKCARAMARTVLLHCPISAEIRTVNNQSD